MTTALRGLLQQALDDHGLQVRIDRRLPAQVWDEAVGPEIALRARPTVLSAGALHVLVIDHRWRDQLDALRSMLIGRINARLGRPLVRELRFGLAHSGHLDGVRAPVAAPVDSAAAGPSVELLAAAERLPEGVREAFLGAAGAHRARLGRA